MYVCMCRHVKGSRVLDTWKDHVCRHVKGYKLQFCNSSTFLKWRAWEYREAFWPIFWQYIYIYSSFADSREHSKLLCNCFCYDIILFKKNFSVHVFNHITQIKRLLVRGPALSRDLSLSRVSSKILGLVTSCSNAHWGHCGRYTTWLWLFCTLKFRPDSSHWMCSWLSRWLFVPLYFKGPGHPGLSESLLICSSWKPIEHFRSEWHVHHIPRLFLPLSWSSWHFWTVEYTLYDVSCFEVHNELQNV
jgi:hypothetical protein